LGVAELVIAVLLGALAQTTAGFGLALICGPVLIAAQGPSDGLRLVLTLSLLSNLLVLTTRYRQARVSDGLWLAVPAVLTAVPIVWLVSQLDTAAVTIAAGVLTVVCAISLWRRLRLSWLHGRGGAIAASIVAEFGNAIGGLSGPSVALYAVNADWPVPSIAPTLQVFGVVTNVITLAIKGGPLLTVPAAIALTAGWLGGSLLSRRMAAESLRLVVLGLAFAGGCYAIVRGLLM
jgi:uncharacterized protein